MTGAPLWIGLSSNMSTHIRRKRAWSNDKDLQSTSMTSPMPLPISLPRLHLLDERKSLNLHPNRDVLKIDRERRHSFSHRRSSKRWLSKLYGPLFTTHSS